MYVVQVQKLIYASNVYDHLFSCYLLMPCEGDLYGIQFELSDKDNLRYQLLDPQNKDY